MAHLYVHAVLALTEVNIEYPSTLQQLLEAYVLNTECRQTLQIVDKLRSNFIVDANGLLVRIAQLDGTVSIYIPAFYHPIISYLWPY